MTKKIIICCDGTWNKAEDSADGQTLATNVVHLALRIAREDNNGRKQIVFYDPGVGTGDSKKDKIIGGITGKGLLDNVFDAYKFFNFELCSR